MTGRIGCGKRRLAGCRPEGGVKNQEIRVGLKFGFANLRKEAVGKVGEGGFFIFTD
jgi:hypothetical protein